MSCEHTQRHPDDKEAVEGQVPMALRGLGSWWVRIEADFMQVDPAQGDLSGAAG